MRKLSAVTVMTAVLTVSSAFVRPERAAADTEITLRLSGITLVGTWANRSWAVTLSFLGCTWRNLGPATLSEPLSIHGTEDDDTIRVLQTPVVWCNRVLEPVTQNGHAIKLHGGEGDDTLYGGGSAPFSGNPNHVFGEAGDDFLYAGPGGVRVEGGDGDDVIFGGDSAGDELYGGAGADVLCERNQVKPLVLDGGEGEDESCAPEAMNSFESVESVTCDPCGFGY
jgi:hypothetical protein